jgi:hypothetical protein
MEIPNFSPSEEVAAWQLSAVLSSYPHVFSLMGIGMNEFHSAEVIADAFSTAEANPENDPNLFIDAIALRNAFSRFKRVLENAFGLVFDKVKCRERMDGFGTMTGLLNF